MSDRLQEINFAVDLIQKICEEANICLIAKEHKGTKYVSIYDNIENKDYCIIKKGEK
jgi:hypothetical protein